MRRDAGQDGSEDQEIQSYDAVFFSGLFEVEDRHFWFRTRNRIIGALTRQLVRDFPAGYKVLEIGCGTGNVLRELVKAAPQGLVIGVDLFLQGLRFARRRVSTPCVQADLHALPFESGFDFIGMFDVIEHIDDDEVVLADLYEMLAPGGYLFITVPAHPRLWSYADEGWHHFRRYQPGELRAKLCSAGLEIEYLTQFMAITYPLMWLARAWTGLVKGKGGVSAERETELALQEFRVTPIANPMLTWLLLPETALVTRRRTLPFGTSLLALARKPVR